MDNNNTDIISILEKLTQQIQTLRQEVLALSKPTSLITNFPVRGNSDLKELYTALAKAQAEMPVAELNKENPYFKSRYADLQSVVQASRPSLTKHGLSVHQEILNNEGRDSSHGATMLITVLAHSSGQYVESRVRIVPPKNDIQTLSSYTTYLKRMSYSSLVGVVTGDEDDDAEIATASYRQSEEKGTALNRNYNPKETSPETISKDQLDELEYELQQYPDIAEMILDGLKIQTLYDMPKRKFLAAIKRIREIKQLRNEGQEK